MEQKTQTSFDSDVETSLAIAANSRSNEPQLAEVSQLPVSPQATVEPKPVDEVVARWVDSQERGDDVADTKTGNTLRRMGRGALAGVAAATVFVSLGANYVSANNESPRTIPTTERQASTGDTLWDMAGDVKDVEDRRDVINWVQNNNPNLTDGLDAGETITMPLDADDIK